MKYQILNHDGRTIDIFAENIDQIQQVLDELSKPEHFIVLKKNEKENIRAAGPIENAFLLQCDVIIDEKKYFVEIPDCNKEQVFQHFKNFLNEDYSNLNLKEQKSLWDWLTSIFSN